MSLSEPLHSSLEVNEDSANSTATYSKLNEGTASTASLLRAYRAAIAVLSLLFLTAAILAVIFYSRQPTEVVISPPAPTAGSTAGMASSTYPVNPTAASSVMPPPVAPTSTPPVMPTSTPPVMPTSTSPIMPATSTPPAPYIPVETETLRALGRDMDFSRDLSADPCDDWYQYSCGGWVEKTSLEGTNLTSITKGFTMARIFNQQFIYDIIMADWPIITPFFQSCMNVDKIVELGSQPIQPLMDMFSPAPSVSPITTTSDLFYQLGKLRTSMRLTALVSANQGANSSRPTQPVLNLGFGGYTNNNLTSPATLDNLVNGITAVFTAIGDAPKDAAMWAQAIVGFEAALQNITRRATAGRGPMSAEDMAEEKRLGQVQGLYTFAQAQALAPTLPLMNFLTATGIPDILRDAKVDGYAYIAQPEDFPRVEQLVAATPLPTLLAYARWRVLNASMPYLAWDVRAVHHTYFGDDEYAVALPNDYTYCSGLVVNNLDDLFGRYFVSLRLQPEKARVARDLITWIRQAFERNLPSISWMDDATRAVALDKAYAVLELVGGPENGNWGDYSQVTITRDSWFMNWFQIQGMRARDQWVQLTKPISRGRFTMNPSLVNAQYSPMANVMTFPAAILQEPFFDFDYPMSVNLGRIGMVMGHELLHGFDNTGRQFDKEGIRRQWWDDSVIYAFRNKSQCIVDQYDNIVVQGARVNGTFTLGENIADNGGLHMAYLALQWYKDVLARNNTIDPVPTNTKAPLTSDQLFYWAHAQTWCTKATDAAIARQVVTDVHSPGEARVWAPIVNQDGFAQAFNCPVGSRMNPAKKCDLY